MRLHRTGFYPDISNVNKNITVEAKLIGSPTYTPAREEVFNTELSV